MTGIADPTAATVPIPNGNAHEPERPGLTPKHTSPLRIHPKMSAEKAAALAWWGWLHGIMEQLHDTAQVLRFAVQDDDELAAMFPEETVVEMVCSFESILSDMGKWAPRMAMPSPVVCPVEAA